MNHAHTDSTAHLVGGGIDTFAGAVYLIRDGHSELLPVGIERSLLLGQGQTSPQECS